MYSHKKQNVEFKVMYERKIEGSKKKGFENSFEREK